MNRHTHMTLTLAALVHLLTGGPWSAAPMAASADARKPFRWQCGVETTCVGDARLSLPEGGSGQLRLVDADGNVLAAMYFYWVVTGPVNSIGDRSVTINVGVGSTSACKLTSDAGFYWGGRIQTFLGGVDTGPEVESMAYRIVKRRLMIPEKAQLTIGPGAAYCSGVISARPSPGATATPAPARSAGPAASYRPAETAAQRGSAFAGSWNCRTDGVGYDYFTLAADGTINLSGSDSRWFTSGNTVRFEEAGDGTFFTKRIFEFSLANGQLRGTRTEIPGSVGMRRAPDVTDYACSRR
jgi:hypothetical protein